MINLNQNQTEKYLETTSHDLIHLKDPYIDLLFGALINLHDEKEFQTLNISDTGFPSWPEWKQHLQTVVEQDQTFRQNIGSLLDDLTDS